MTVSVPSRPYDVCFDAGLLFGAGEVMRAAKKSAGRVAIVTDEAVGARYAGIVRLNLEAAGFLPSVVNIPAGQAGRTLETAARLCDAFEATGLSRGDVVAALGGTSVCSAALFAAAIYLGGTDFVALPTTLAAQAGAAAGGVARVALSGGEMLAGTYHPPRLVLCDTDCLASLPEDVRAAGVAEIIRTALVADAVLLKRLEKGMTPESMAERCCKDRIALIEQDEAARGAQKVLSFGHAVGDALQKTTGCPSGAALAAGMAAALRMTERMELLQEPALPARLEALLARFSLPARVPCDVDALFHAVMQDRRRAAGDVEIVLVPSAGCAQLCRISAEALQTLLREVL